MRNIVRLFSKCTFFTIIAFGLDARGETNNQVPATASWERRETGSPAADPVTQVSGAGLDYRSWNGVLLQGPTGALFGVRVGYVENGKLVTGSAFYEKVARVGDYDPEGKYACVTTDGIKLEWRIEGNALYGMVSVKSAIPIVVELYPAHDYSGAVIPAGAYIPFRNQATFVARNFAFEVKDVERAGGRTGGGEKGVDSLVL